MKTHENNEQKKLDKRCATRYNYFRHLSAGIAQLVEQLICNQQVVGSSPIASSKCGRIPEWLKGADCKSAADGFVGSNPTPSTTIAGWSSW